MHIRHRTVATFCAIALAFAGAAIASIAVAQAPVQVQQGQEVDLGAVNAFSDVFSVDPVAAGTVDRIVVTDPVTAEPVSATLSFTASATYTGTAVISQFVTGESVFVATVNVVGPRADVGATFTPRPAPGPCIQIVSGGTVGFGDVTVGATTTAATETVLRNCSSGLDVDIFGSITEATSGTGPSAVVWEPVQTTPTPNQFRYRLQNSGDSVDRVLDNDTSVFVQRLPNSFTRSFNHALTIGAGSTTGLNSAFSATIILVATTAAP